MLHKLATLMDPFYIMLLPGSKDTEKQHVYAADQRRS